jgi:hypothetical protein
MKASLSLFLVIAISLIGCKGGSSVVGTYRIQQDNNVLGEGAEKGELELKDDKSFEITIGPLKMASGTYTSTDTTVDLSANSGKMGTSYKIQDSKLIPMVNGKEVTAWRFVKK